MSNLLLYFNHTKKGLFNVWDNADGTLAGASSGVQQAADVTTNGAANFGLNYNPTGEGPRKDWNFSLMYDTAGPGLSASVGYTDPGSNLGMTSTVNRDGLSTSLEHNGISIGTNGPNGFQMDEINFAEQNINAAQDQSQDNQSNRDTTDADPTRNQDSDNDFFADMGEAAGVAIAGLLAGGAGLVTGLFGGGTGGATTGGNASPVPTNTGVVATDEPVRRREDEEGGDDVAEGDTDNSILLADATKKNPYALDFLSQSLRDQMGYYDPRMDPDNLRPSDDVRSRETIIDIIDRPARESLKLTQPQLETYREKISKFEKNVKDSEPPVVKTDNLLVSEENDLKNLREKRTELIKSFQQKILDDIRKSPTDAPYKESADLAKLRKVFETELAKVDKGIKRLNAKADIPFKTPVKSKDIVAEATSRTNFEKIMNLSKDEASQRNRELTIEQDKKSKVDKDLEEQRSKIVELDKAFDSLEKMKSKLPESEVIAAKKLLQEYMTSAKQDYAVKLEKQESVYKEAFERKTKESTAILNKIYGDQKKTLETELESIKDSKLKTDIDNVKKIKADIAQLETNKNAAIDSIDNKYKSSTVIVLDRSQDAKADKDAKFHNPKVLIDQYTQSNLKFINESLYPSGAPEFSTKELPGNPTRQQLVLKDSAGVDSGVIILGTQGVNQHSDYGEKVIVVSDQKEDIPAGSWDSDLGKYIYIQAGGNTCQSYTLLGQMVQEGVKFRDNSEVGRKLIHELTRLQYQKGETGNMSTDTINAYNRILDQFGLKAKEFTSQLGDNTAKHNAIKEQLRNGKIVNSGMYLDAPPAAPKYNEKGEIKEPSQGHRVNIVGFDDVKGEWIVNDSNQKGELTRYKYSDFELGNRWSTVLEKK